MYQQLQNLRQGLKTVDKYTKVFYKYLTWVDLAEMDDQFVSRYIGGLWQNIQDSLNLFYPINVSVAHQRAILLEKTAARGSTGFFGRGTKGNTTRYNGSLTPWNTTQSTNPNRAPITTEPLNQGPAMSGPKCFKCGKLSHRIKDCHKWEKFGKGLLIDSGNAFDEQGEKEEQEATFDNYGDVEEEFITEDNGPSLMVQRICFTPWKAEGDDGQRHNLFHSTCTIGGKVCKLVIDGGNYENVVADEAVQKLALDTEKHPTSYRLEWLKKGNEVIVSKRCHVKFSTGTKYKDKIWCDVVAMDACHLLLGRLWQYDQNVHHDGRKNSYSFLVDNMKLTLLPNLGDMPKPPKKVGQTLLAKREFIREMLNADQVYLLYDKECNPTKIIPEAVTGLLEEFPNVFPKDLPEELPPLRNIQHQIDLVPGSSLPNRPHYRMSPKEHEELWWQTKDWEEDCCEVLFLTRLR